MPRPPRQPDLEVMFELTSLNLEGGTRFVLSGYRPIYDVRRDYWTSAHHEFVGVDRVLTGGRELAEVWLLSPEAYPRSLWLGRKVRVAEGSRIVGTAEVTKIMNPILQADTQCIFSDFGIEILHRSDRYYLRYDAGGIVVQMTEIELSVEDVELSRRARNRRMRSSLGLRPDVYESGHA